MHNCGTRASLSLWNKGQMLKCADQRVQFRILKIEQHRPRPQKPPQHAGSQVSAMMLSVCWFLALPSQILGPYCLNSLPTKTQTSHPFNPQLRQPNQFQKSFDKIWSADQLHSTYLTFKIKSHSLKIKNSVSNQNEHQTQNRTKSNETTSKSSPIQSAPAQSNQSNSIPHPNKFDMKHGRNPRTPLNQCS